MRRNSSPSGVRQLYCYRDKKTVVTITEPVEVGTAVLEPGTYVLKRIG